ncbi:hypothetical protein [Aureivirga sp. CE67]|uniref:hypothetical protein n=1 Tax=Aureivirga sp. CE67 TaxID=1788983 RepID=UPI0018CAF215|nr:hypothetical protein [Aureivirga sp. CE67]
MLKKYIWIYYGIAILLNVVPILLMLIGNENIQGERGLGLFIFIPWALLCALVYISYFFILTFKRKSHKIIGLFVPVILMSFLIIPFSLLSYLILLNLILNGIFSLHFVLKYEDHK